MTLDFWREPSSESQLETVDEHEQLDDVEDVLPMDLQVHRVYDVSYIYLLYVYY